MKNSIFKIMYKQKFILVTFFFTILSLMSFINKKDIHLELATKCKDAKIECVNRLQQKPKMTCATLFPDKAFALYVAFALNKSTVNDAVTFKELASFKGAFGFGYDSEVSDLTGIGYLTGITSLSFSKTMMPELPAEIGKLTNIVSIDILKVGGISKLPPEIGKLKKLKYLRVLLAGIKSIPKEIGQLTNLETLLLCCNQLTEVPKEIGNLKKLKELDLHSNVLKTIPDEMSQLTSLTSLDLSHTELQKLPENIGNLTELKSLNLFNNRLKYLPKSISQLSKLSSLNIYDNVELRENYKNYLPILLRTKAKK